ncbi:helix-turn-helix domain-containing protein [Streptomyces beijiangensis]|uniref:Helix-turn-helix domain-containing protein n=1 Tax=Streptomyces beijiangensis TaxID=163361 RepID=A0A939FC84_9ACTN|nr:helix-turn-helix domain-containing protein [Streptomyces beijiangensis]MBO0516400.1 helix-turn-helix domain-containing protein [Streptomyces beijiangensis]
MLRQPAFGQRLKKMRGAQGLSQTALAGDGMSTGYLSRLESGARQPTERAVTYLAERLGVQPDDFEEPAGGSLAHALSLAASTGADDSIETLRDALAAEGHEAPVLRWQALWQLAEHRRLQVDYAGERAYLDELIRLGDEVGLAELRVRGLSRLSRCLRALGEIADGLDAALTAHRLARENSLGVEDQAGVLLALTAVETEAGRLPDARAHADELTVLVEGRCDARWAEAMWSAASIRTRQGDYPGAQFWLEQALERFPSAENLVLWLRLRLAAGRLYLQKTPADPEAAERCVVAAEQALAFVGTDGLRQQLNSLKVELAFLSGRYDDARALLDELAHQQLRMTHRDQVRLDIFRHQLSILNGDESGVDGLRALAEQAHADANIDLAAHIWRILAKALTELQQRGRAEVTERDRAGR